MTSPFINVAVDQQRIPRGANQRFKVPTRATRNLTPAREQLSQEFYYEYYSRPSLFCKVPHQLRAVLKINDSPRNLIFLPIFVVFRAFIRCNFTKAVFPTARKTFIDLQTFAYFIFILKRTYFTNRL
jgi:hypothetical protein